MTLMTNHIPKAGLLTPSPWGLIFQHMNLGDIENAGRGKVDLVTEET